MARQHVASACLLIVAIGLSAACCFPSRSSGPQAVTTRGDTPAARPAPVGGAGEWASAPAAAPSVWYKLGSIEITVESVKIGPVALTGIRGDGDSEKPVTQIAIKIRNNDAAKLVSYRPWMGGRYDLGREFGELEDEHGNFYKRVGFGISNTVVGQVASDASIYPGKVESDVLVFQQPVDAANELRLLLPGKNVGQVGAFRIRLPKSLWKNP